MGQDARIYQLIDRIRLPMIIGIVFCHTHFYKYLSPEEQDAGLWVNYPALNGVIYVCYWLVGKIFTPAFFFLSGYLFFREGRLNRDIYAGKIRRRVRSLLVPYLVWNAVMLAVMYVQERYMGGTSGRMGRIAAYGWQDWLYAFWDCTQTWSCTGVVGQPANIPLWFLRELMILSVFSPLFYFLSRLRKPVGVVLLGLVYVCPYHLPHVQNLSVFWFGMGVWTQMNGVDFVGFSERAAKWCVPLFAVFAVAYEALKRYAPELPLEAAVAGMRITEFPVLVATVSAVLRKTSWRLPEKVSRSAFFVYLGHIVPTAALCSLTCRFFPHTDAVLTAAYLVIPFAVTGALAGCYIVLERYMPRTMKVLTGSR